MLDFFKENAATIVVLAIVAGLAAAAILHIIKNRRGGRTSCGCGCASCPMGADCHKQPKQK